MSQVPSRSHASTQTGPLHKDILSSIPHSAGNLLQSRYSSRYDGERERNRGTSTRYIRSPPGSVALIKGARMTSVNTYHYVRSIGTYCTILRITTPFLSILQLASCCACYMYIPTYITPRPTPDSRLPSASNLPTYFIANLVSALLSR